MTLLNLLPKNDHALTQEAQRVGLPGIFTDQLISNLYETMYFHNGLGLAAPQVGISQKVAVMDTESIKLTFINPIITEKSKEIIESNERCLSCPNIEVTVQRHTEITIINYDLQGNKSEIKLNGQAAITAQHEIDHLNGILITHKLSSLKKQFYTKKIK